ncbi:MAG: hypothetical protein ABI658_20990 [Acidimicrobiales bacterium]
MAVYVSLAKRRRHTAVVAVATLVVGLVIGFAIGTTRTTSLDDRVQAVHTDADRLATRLVALDIEYRDALAGGGDDFDTSVTAPLAKVQADTVHLLDRAPWVGADQRGEVLDKIAKLAVLAKARTAADDFLTALNDASALVRSTFGAG